MTLTLADPAESRSVSRSRWNSPWHTPVWIRRCYGVLSQKTNLLLII